MLCVVAVSMRAFLGSNIFCNNNVIGNLMTGLTVIYKMSVSFTAINICLNNLIDGVIASASTGKSFSKWKKEHKL